MKIFALSNGILNPLGMTALDNLEDVIDGHIWIGVICIAGGIWHIANQPYSWAKNAFTDNGDAILWLLMTLLFL